MSLYFSAVLLLLLLTTVEADTIRILVATDNHVGYEERDPIRRDDSWRTFDEILNLARTEDVRPIALSISRIF